MRRFAGKAPRLDRYKSDRYKKVSVMPRVGLRESLGPVVCGAPLALTAVFAFRRIDDFDTWWHLATGRWIVEHRMIPATDVLSHTVRGHPWINLEWAYEVVIYLLYSAGGPVLLSLAAAF